MGKIEYRKGDMFDQDGKGKIFVHACNAQGVWGSGIAKIFKDKYPQAFHHYRNYCRTATDARGNSSISGNSIVLFDSNTEQYIGCLFTSQYYGDMKDSPEKILKNTEKALKEFFFQPDIVIQNIEIHSPKINSGLFNVPWEKTEQLIETALHSIYAMTDQRYKWIVWEV